MNFSAFLQRAEKAVSGVGMPGWCVCTGGEGLSFGLLFRLFAFLFGGLALSGLGGQRPGLPERGLRQEVPRRDAEVARRADERVVVGQRA